MLEIALDLLAKCGRGRHGVKAIFAFCSPIESDNSNAVVNPILWKHGKSNAQTFPN